MKQKWKAAAVFSSNMVLQRDKVIRVFGEGPEGKSIAVHLYKDGRKCTRTTQVENGKWMVCLPPHAAGEGYTMLMEADAFAKKLENIAIGEVWLCGGQSNMEMELQNIKDGKEHLKQDHPHVRFYYTQKNGYMDEAFFESEEKMVWKEFSEEAAACWSGVGYLYGKRLSEELGVTVGLIGCNWGGTSASVWTSRESMEQERDLQIYLQEYEEANAGKTEEEQIAEYLEYEAYHNEWNQRCEAFYREHPNGTWEEAVKQSGPCKWPGPINCRNPFRPTGLYESMLCRVAPYSLRGFLFYQGETDDNRPERYRKLMGAMLAEWRRIWMEDTLPFLFVQLPMHRYAADPDYKHWCLIREAQMQAYQTIRNTGLAVLSDCGEYNEIHPKDKVPVADRLFLQAMSEVYGKLTREQSCGPIYRDSYCDGDSIICRFDHAEEGFIVKTEGYDTLSEQIKTVCSESYARIRAGKICGFEIGGKDGRMMPAEAFAEGNCIRVRAAEVPNPVYVHYLWTNFGLANLYGKNGIPVAPFRTEVLEAAASQKEHGKQTEIRQVMEL